VHRQTTSTTFGTLVNAITHLDPEAANFTELLLRTELLEACLRKGVSMTAKPVSFNPREYLFEQSIAVLRARTAVALQRQADRVPAWL
jgi:hypothetical protein